MEESGNLMVEEVSAEYFRYLEKRLSDVAVPMSIEAFFQLEDQVYFSWLRSRKMTVPANEACGSPH